MLMFIIVFIDFYQLLFVNVGFSIWSAIVTNLLIAHIIL